MSSSSHWLAGLVCAYLAYSSYHRWFSTAETAGTSLVHSFVEELAEVTKQRYAKFDGEDMVAYMESAHPDIRVRIYVAGALFKDIKGYDEYYKEFQSILTNFAEERRVNGHHVLMPGNMTISRDASVTVDLPYEMYETAKGNPSAPRQWKSSGWYRNRWVSSNPGSRQLKDWKLKDYDIFVEVTSNDFGQSEGACDGLC